jgi:sulfur dioxygenase
MLFRQLFDPDTWLYIDKDIKTLLFRQLFDSATWTYTYLPDDTLVYPAHDYRGHTVSTIGEEKQWNPRFVGKSREDFIQFMNALDLPNPKKIMEAVPANEQCGRVGLTARSQQV